MKLLTVILAIVIVALAHAANIDWKVKTPAEAKQIRQECIQEHPLTKELVDKVKHFEYPDEEPVRQYLLCTAVKMGIFCEHEGYHATRMAKQFKMDMDESEVLAIAKSCIDNNQQNSPIDVWVFRTHNCMMASKVGDKVKSFILKKMEEAKKPS